MKIFSHRGLVDKNNPENSLKAFKNSQKNGFKAIEFDIWYLQKQLILSHNKPVNLNKFDQLENLFKQFKNQFDYWLDFKNLNPRNCDQALLQVKEIIKKNKINLSKLNFAPFITDFKKAEIIYKSIRKHFGSNIKILAVIEKLPEKNYQKYFQKLKENKIYGLSIFYKNINPEFIKIFSNIKIFAWTVNDKRTLQLLDKMTVKNIATDKKLI